MTKTPSPPPQYRWRKNGRSQKLWDWLWQQDTAKFWTASDSVSVARYTELMTGESIVSVGGHNTEKRFYRLQPTMLAEIRHLEDRLGLSLKSRRDLDLKPAAVTPAHVTDEVQARRGARRTRLGA